MIKNNRKSDFPVPSSLTNAGDALEHIAKSGDKKLIKDYVYKGEYKKEGTGKIKYEVRETLKKIYYNKCAYCEIKEYKPEIEHYRPKGGVTGLKHPGYYWLCYEWTNLLPSCHYCNTDEGKRNHFPIKGRRVRKPAFIDGNLDKQKCKAECSPLRDERPYLLHPEIDSPEDCFAFDRKGKMKGSDEEKRGQQTIKICNLNRENLLYYRQKIIEDIKKEIVNAFLAYFEDTRSRSSLNRALKLIFSGMEKATTPREAFSLMSLYCYNHFAHLVASQLPTPGQAEIAVTAFNLYKAGKL